MRGFILAISIPALMIAGAASATSTPGRQCPAPWSQTSSENICVEGGICRTPTLTRVAFTGANGREDHVLSRAEIRAELDAVRLRTAETVQLALEDR